MKPGDLVRLLGRDWPYGFVLGYADDGYWKVRTGDEEILVSPCDTEPVQYEHLYVDEEGANAVR